jgi:serine/threonine-protein phosphatase 2A regulatory subunit B''
MLDMIVPKKHNVISLQDLRSCRMTPIFFDTFFNLEKYLDHEQRDPFASSRDVDEDGNEVKIIFNKTVNPSSPYPRALY